MRSLFSFIIFVGVLHMGCAPRSATPVQSPSASEATPIEKVEQEAAMIRDEMQGAMKLKVPLKVEVGWGKNWQEGK